MIWSTWASGVLSGIGAPLDATNLDTLWGWSNAESGADVMRWNNPLNTSWYMPGAIAENNIPIWRYLSVQDGIDATVHTMLGGPRWPDPFPQYYPVILANLRSSAPRAQWANACPNLGLWGTGCGWLQQDYGAAPGNIGVLDMTDAQYYAIYGAAARGEIWDAAGVPQGPTPFASAMNAKFAELEAKVSAISGGSGTEPTKISLNIPSITATGTIS